jgi:hypothetical protein
MRHKFQQQLTIGITPISEVKIPTKSRDELPPVLAALQHIFNTPALNEKVFAILEAKIKADKKNTGRTGMDLWEILVLAVVRMALNINYDRLHYLSNFDKLVREIMGVENRVSEGKTYGLQTLKDNVSLLDEETVNQINTLVVETAHQFVLKKNETLRIKSDTYVLETNVHFPTDLNLLWDSARKCIDIMTYCKKNYNLKEWRKSSFWRSSLKSLMRSCGKACASTSKNKQTVIRSRVEEYLRLSKEIDEKVTKGAAQLKVSPLIDWPLLYILEELDYYQKMLKKHIDLVDRRLLRGEQIPTEEKIYSIFEPHTEWISKGKQNKKVELGHKILIATDQNHFIIHHVVIDKQADNNLAIPLVDALLNKYKNRKIESLSLDKGFYSKENKELLSLEIPAVIMPKKGKPTKAEKEEESAKPFKKLRNAHSAVESNINQLEYNGLDRCPDKGIRGYKRYVSLGILSYNLHRLGRVLQQQARREIKKSEELKKAA